MKELQQIIRYCLAEKLKASKEIEKLEDDGKDATHEKGRWIAFNFTLIKARLLLKNMTRKQHQETAILQTPCKAKFATGQKLQIIVTVQAVSGETRS
jgi:hypothetical protein